MIKKVFCRLARRGGVGLLAISLSFLLAPGLSMAYTQQEAYVTTTDGTKLAVTYILPEGSGRAGPVIFQYLPYHRFSIDPSTGRVDSNYALEWLATRLTDSGYGFVIADMRGSGASTGSRTDMESLLGRDGKEIIDWIADQPWCDGNVGMMGGSYHGWSQYATAGQAPAALKAIAPEAIAFDMYNDAWFPGGIPNEGCLSFLEPVLTLLDINYNLAGHPKLKPTLPVTDEDGDGELADEIPLDVDGSGSFLDDGFPPAYSDGQTRQHVYYYATLDHLSNTNMGDWADSVTYRDDIVGGTEKMYQTGPNDWPVKMASTNVAVLAVAGWFDIFTRGQFLWYATLNKTNPVKLVVHPSFHCAPDTGSSNAGPYWDHFGASLADFAAWLTDERIRFFDQYLKGVDPPAGDNYPIRIFVMNGEGWREEKEWPLARQETRTYYFGPGRSLATQPGWSPGQGERYDSYRADFSASSTYGSKGIGTRWIPDHAPDSVMIRTNHDAKCLTYTSDPLSADTEVTGHPVVNLWIASTADYGDFLCLPGGRRPKRGGKLYHRRPASGRFRRHQGQRGHADQQLRDRRFARPALARL